MRFEHQSEPVARAPVFYARLLRSVLVGVVLIVGSLIAGMLGYRYLEQLSWIDAYENAAMILSGMGPMYQPQSVAGKLFAGSYALFSGIAVLVIAGVIFAPVVHRFLHRLHADEAEGE
jgi:hypothetical protein